MSRSTRIPSFVKRAPETKQLPQMLIDGEVDAALIGDKFPDPRFKTLVPDAETANKDWAMAHGGVPINHMVIVREKIAKERPDVVEEIFRCFKAARDLDTIGAEGRARSVPVRRRGQPRGAGAGHRLFAAGSR